MREQRLGALAVRLAAVDAAAARHADRDRRGEVAGRAVAQPRRLGHDLVRRRVEVVGELHLDHRPQPVGGHADRRADDAAFGDRRVEHARLAVLGLQPFGAAEHAAEVADVLAVDDDVVVALRASRPSPSAAPGSSSSSPSLSLLSRRQVRGLAQLLVQVRRHVLVDVLEHRLERRDVAVERASRAVSASFNAALTSASSSCCSACVLLVGPCARPIRCCFSRSIGSPSGKCCQSSARPVARRVVRRRMRAGAVA